MSFDLRAIGYYWVMGQSIICVICSAWLCPLCPQKRWLGNWEISDFQSGNSPSKTCIVDKFGHFCTVANFLPKFILHMPLLFGKLTEFLFFQNPNISQSWCLGLGVPVPKNLLKTVFAKKGFVGSWKLRSSRYDPLHHNSVSPGPVTSTLTAYLTRTQP